MARVTRAHQFQANEIGIVHAVQRCVRRAFLAGIDRDTGQDFSFRREWIRRRLEALASVFGIDVLSYAVMCNHLHLILRNRPDVVAAWSDQEVAMRWLRMFPGRRLEEHLGEPNQNDVQSLINQPRRLALIRERLSDISWFMRALSEPIARMANRQDQCTGRFWEGRFKALRIVDEAGLLACAMYVDLNPVRAALAEGPEQAVHTSAYDRLQGEQGQLIDAAAFDLVEASAKPASTEICQQPILSPQPKRQWRQHRASGRRIRRDAWLAPLTLMQDKLSQEPQVHHDGLRASDKGFLQVTWGDYLTLLRWTAGQMVDGLVYKLPEDLARVLASLGIEASMWRDLVWHFKKYFGRCACAGAPGAMASHAQRVGKRWHRGQKTASVCFAHA